MRWCQCRCFYGSEVQSAQAQPSPPRVSDRGRTAPNLALCLWENSKVTSAAIEEDVCGTEFCSSIKKPKMKFKNIVRLLVFLNFLASSSGLCCKVVRQENVNSYSTERLCRRSCQSIAVIFYCTLQLPPRQTGEFSGEWSLFSLSFSPSFLLGKLALHFSAHSIHVSIQPAEPQHYTYFKRNEALQN